MSQYRDPDGSVVPGVALEIGGKALDGTNPLPNRDPKEVAIRAARYFVFSTNEQTLAGGQYLNVVLSNPANSGVRFIVTKRRYDNSIPTGTAPMAYGGIPLPAAYAPGTTGLINVNGTNQLRDAVKPQPTSLITMQALVSTTRLNNATNDATPTGSGRLSTGGMPTKLTEWSIIMPGTTIGFYLQCPTGLATSYGAGLTLYGIQEPISANG